MGQGEIGVITLDGAVNAELREERVGGIRQRSREALLRGKTPGPAVADRTAESQTLQEAVLLFLPRIEASLPMISGSLVVLLVSMPLPLNAPTVYWTTPPSRSPWIATPGLR